MNNWGSVDQAFLTMVMLLINTVKQNCLFLVPAFLLTGLIVAIIHSVFSQSQMNVNGDFMLRGVLVWCVLFNYIEIIDLVTGGIEGFRNLIPQPTSILEDLNEFSNMALSTSKTIDDPNMPAQDRLMAFAKGLFDFNFGLLYFVNAAFEEGLTMLIRIGLEKIRAMLLAFLTVAGPLSLTLSLFPGMEKVASHWFRGWFSVHMWSVTIRILDAIIHNYNQAVFTHMSDSSTVMIDSLVVNIVCMLMYLMVPTLTSYFVGQALTNGFLSKLAGTAATVVGTAMAAGKVFGGAASSRAGSSIGQNGSSLTNLGSIGSPSGGGGSPALNQAASQPLLGSGGNQGLLGGPPISPSPVGGGGGGPLLLSGGNASIPVRQKPPTPQPRINANKIPYTDYESM
ncbi:hypothetical protein QNI16_35915 [Cytophagaceae bacterium YF14B1]|uniref:Conjugative transposon TraJ C-terminal domain-containing protein n=1 Tax=Xanthocytophaga flava TaxID=3048013 RepID=A0AAE3UA93_9BACT|nr:hypothetical protein [Xanthocytophaga flavus]MDJ1485924.1 hypothetical protein [Xanthocytophaga flavus]